MKMKTLVGHGAKFGSGMLAGIAKKTPIGMGIGAVARIGGMNNPINSLKSVASSSVKSAVSGPTPQPNAKDIPTVEAKEVTVSNSVASSTPGASPGAESTSINGQGLSSSESKSIGDSLIELGNATSALGKVLVGMKSGAGALGAVPGASNALKSVQGAIGSVPGASNALKSVQGTLGSVPGASNALKSVQGAIGSVPGMKNLTMVGGYSRKKRRKLKTIKSRKSRKSKKFKYSLNRKR